jgi:glycosyltransferase involved in cell wall biosynthesis
MPSILIFCKTFLKGGAEKQALTLTKLLTERKIKTILIIWSGKKIDPFYLEFIKNNSIRFIGLKGNPVKKTIRFFEIIKEEKITIILSYLTFANTFAGITRLFNKKLFTIGGIRAEKLPFLKFISEKIVHNYLNDATVYNNYSAKNKFIKKGFNPEKIHVIHNSILVSPIQKRNKNKNEIIIISVHRFVSQKDIPTALHCIRMLMDKTRKEKIKYRMVGYGPLESEVRLIIAQLDMIEDVDIIINPQNIPELLNSSDIYFSSSLWEGISNSIMEAMVAGLPIVATDVGDNTYLIKDNFNGFIVPKKDISLMVEKLEYLISSEKIRTQFGTNSYSLIRNEFSEEKLLDNYLQFFDEMSML